MGHFLLLLCTSFFVHLLITEGCEIDGVTQWLEPQHFHFKDIHSGLIISQNTRNIQGINGINFADGLNRGPYLEILHSNSVLTVGTTDAFALYEEYETQLSIRFTVTFSCTGGSIRVLTYVFNIIDTNNHAPVFIPTNSFEFPLSLPVSPGFKVSGCDYIIVRDIDLTTQKIDFVIQENDYFEIVYYGQTQPKEFGAIIRTKTLIRSLAESLSLTMEATDVDLTEDDPLTTTGVVNIVADNAFRLPDTPVFSAAFYRADYTNEHDLILMEGYISLREGYDDQVRFGIEGEYADHFNLINNGNRISFQVKSPLPEDISESQILLVVVAEREFTSGARATVVVHLPKDIELQFELPLYEGHIEDNTLRAPGLTLLQGYEDISQINIINEYASYFLASRDANIITLSMNPLPTAVIQNNNILNIQVVASTNNNVSASTIVVLEIIKDDYITPVFERLSYSGTYDPETGLVIEPIVFLQGFDNTVSVSLKGDYSTYFDQVTQNAEIKLTASIPPEIWSERNILITVEATKPRTVGANTAVVINLPTARKLSFEQSTYRGSLENNELSLEIIELSLGYEADVTFDLSGEHSSYFIVNNTQNQVTITLQTEIPENILLDNNALMLFLSASGLNAVTTSANILLDIIRDDNVTPVFEKALYNGIYDSMTGLSLREIVIIQGYDETVEVILKGDHAQLFTLNQEGSRIILNGIVRPDIWPEQTLILTLTATKPRTVGANTVIHIALPAARNLTFAKPSYRGSLENNELSLEIIELSLGYNEDVTFDLSGDFSSYFTVNNKQNHVTITLQTEIPENILLDNNALMFSLTASGLNAVTTFTNILLDIVREENVIPVFEKAIYNGIYDSTTGLSLEEIVIVQGYDDTVKVVLNSDHNQMFTVKQEGPRVTINGTIPPENWPEQYVILTLTASKPGTVGANTVIHIILPAARNLGFQEAYYRGSFEDNEVSLEVIELSLGYEEDVSFNISGEFSSFFAVTNSQNQVVISLQSELPENIILENNALMLSLTASGLNAVTTSTNILLDIIRDDHITPVFSKAVYNGLYDPTMGLSLEEIVIVQGYDDTMEVVLNGDHAQLFTLKQEGPSITITGSISPELWPEQNIVLTLKATKPRTVGANAFVHIFLPAARLLSFEKSTYAGNFKNNIINIEAIILSVGYSPDVVFNITGVYSDHFKLSNEGNKLSINVNTPLTEEFISENNFIALTISASGLNAVSTTTAVLLEIIRNDTTTPVFSQHVYRGFYTNMSYYEVEQISLIQGYDNSVLFSLEGDHAQYFILDVTDNNIRVSVKTEIPEELIFNEKLLLFKVSAEKDLTVGATSTVSIQFPTELTEPATMGFSQSAYMGSLKDDNIEIRGTIILETGYRPNTQFNLLGEYAEYFALTSSNNIITVVIKKTLPADQLRDIEFIVLEIEAQRVRAVTVTTAVVIDIMNADAIVFPIFEKPLYSGTFSREDGLQFEAEMRLASGFDETVTFNLEGDDSQWFTLRYISSNSIGLSLNAEGLPENINQNYLIFSIVATKPDNIKGRSVIFISLTGRSLRFLHDHYNGYIEEETLSLDVITLEDGYYEDVDFSLIGDYNNYFQIKNEDGNITMELILELPHEIKEKYNVLIFSLEARTNIFRTHTTLVIEIKSTAYINPGLDFQNTYYTGTYSQEKGLKFDSLMIIRSELNDPIQFDLQGENTMWFGLKLRSTNSVELILSSPIPPEVLENNRKLIFVVTATRPESVMARATIVISLTDDHTISSILAFEQNSYTGSIDDDTLNLKPIVLHEGFTAQVSFTLHGDLMSHFVIDSNGPIVILKLRNAIPEEFIPQNRIILLELQASAAQAIPAIATIVLNINGTNDALFIEQLSFEEAYYTGVVTAQSGLSFNRLISLSHGYDDRVTFTLEGDNSIWFGLELRSTNSVELILSSPISPEVLENNRKLIFVVTATRPESVMARATIVISLTNESPTNPPRVSFDKILYNGIIRVGNVMHESITLSGYTGTNINIFGQHAELFEAKLTDKEVVITSRPSVVLPDVSHIVLELQAGSARAVLALDIIDPETPVLPTVTFGSPSYVLRVDVTHTGSVGRVHATSDNGEAVGYSLNIDDDHLQTRLTISNEGELWLSAPVNTGMYSFQVVARTVISGALATAPVHLAVEAATVCGGDIVVPPLIILERDEEEPHRNLVMLNENKLEGCQFTLSNIWPEGQTWLYVDEDGLHTRSIDREHESIAFMTVSQIQVELILVCEGDVTSRSKRSLRSKSTADWLGPYEYGTNKWILTDTIPYNARRSLVNLIVNDINDNVPIFVGKENEPIVVGYPVGELESIILPTALVELKATDADIGENAALIYWSEEESLAISPTTGFVHIRNSSNLRNNAIYTVHATDQNGAGHTGSLELMVKLLEKNYIAVLNIRNAFLENEEQILGNLSKTAGYEIKSLKTLVISESISSRNMRDASIGLAATLQLYVYGLIEREPVEIKQLITDINNDVTTVNVASIISLEDHLKPNEISIVSVRDNGLLAATIVLSVLIFLLIVAIAVWYFLKRRKNNNYEQFSDRNSTATRDVSIEEPKSDITTKPRMNIEDLKRSERKLQERLDAPVNDILSEPSVSIEKPMESIIDISTPDPQPPFIIQTIDKLKDNTEEDSDDDDEFGERLKSRRKSVVTFNENVEKIIHVEENREDKSVEDYEVFKF